ncbi:MAG: hypothetical protein ACOYES_04095 [Bacillota bacterium]
MTILFEIPAVFEYIDLRIRLDGLINDFLSAITVISCHFAASTRAL